MRKHLVAGAAGIAATVVVAFATPASAFECYNAIRSALINFRTLMARGLERTHPDMLDDGSGIDHLSDEFFATVDPLIDEAFGLCG